MSRIAATPGGVSAVAQPVPAALAPQAYSGDKERFERAMERERPESGTDPDDKPLTTADAIVFQAFAQHVAGEPQPVIADHGPAMTGPVQAVSASVEHPPSLPYPGRGAPDAFINPAASIPVAFATRRDALPFQSPVASFEDLVATSIVVDEGSGMRGVSGNTSDIAPTPVRQPRDPLPIAPTIIMIGATGNYQKPIVAKDTTAVATTLGLLDISAIATAAVPVAANIVAGTFSEMPVGPRSAADMTTPLGSPDFSVAAIAGEPVAPNIVAGAFSEMRVAPSGARAVATTIGLPDSSVIAATGAPVAVNVIAEEFSRLPLGLEAISILAATAGAHLPTSVVIAPAGQPVDPAAVAVDESSRMTEIATQSTPVAATVASAAFARETEVFAGGLQEELIGLPEQRNAGTARPVPDMPGPLPAPAPLLAGSAWLGPEISASATTSLRQVVQEPAWASTGNGLRQTPIQNPFARVAVPTACSSRSLAQESIMAPGWLWNIAAPTDAIVSVPLMPVVIASAEPAGPTAQAGGVPAVDSDTDAAFKHMPAVTTPNQPVHAEHVTLPVPEGLVRKVQDIVDVPVETAAKPARIIDAEPRPDAGPHEGAHSSPGPQHAKQGDHAERSDAVAPMNAATALPLPSVAPLASSVADPAAVPAQQLHKLISALAERMLIDRTGQEVRMRLRDDVLPGVEVRLYQHRGAWQVELSVTEAASLALLQGNGERMAQTLARRLRCGVELRISANNETSDADDSQGPLVGQAVRVLPAAGVSA